MIFKLDIQVIVIAFAVNVERFVDVVGSTSLQMYRKGGMDKHDEGDRLG